jgi:hypothetical protein
MMVSLLRGREWKGRKEGRKIGTEVDKGEGKRGRDCCKISRS